MFAEMYFRQFEESEPAVYHEAGHIAVALSFDEKVIIITHLDDRGNGIAGISIGGFGEEQLHYIGVAGFLTEAKAMSRRLLNVHQASATIANVSTGLMSREKGFKIQVPVAGNAIQEAGCSRDDFVWRKGNHNVAKEFNRTLAEEAAKDVAADLNKDHFWTRVEGIANTLRSTRRFRNGI